MTFFSSGRLHPLTLTFRDPQLETLFLEDYRQKLVKLARFTIAFGAVYIVCFSILDYIRIPDKFQLMLGLRLLTGLLLCGVLATTWTRLFDRWNQQILVFGTWVAAFMVMVMLHIMTPEESFHYYTSLGHVILFVHILLGIRIVQGVISTLAIIGSYNYFAIAIKHFSTELMTIVDSYLFGISVIAIIGGYLLERYKRNSFYQLQLTGHFREEAEKATEAKSRFLSGMTHELRTPLNAIIGYSDLMLEELDETPKEELRWDLDRVRSAGAHLLSLVNDILDIGKIEAGKLALNRTTVNLADLLEQVETAVRPLAAQRRNLFRLETANLPQTVCTDSVRVRQILINLLGNACKFTERGEIVLKVTATGSALVFAISDTGIGMDKETVAHLFEDYHQANADDGISGGTGLGLSISKQLATLMGGHISVRSQPGRGTTFEVTLPLVQD